MNALCYKIVFSKRLGNLVAVGEHTVGQGKTASGSGVRTVINGAIVSGAINSFIGALSAVFAAVALTFLTASFTASVGLAAGPATNALPSGASVNSGSVAISSTSSSNAAVMNITQTTDKASVNWNSFNIGSAARVNVQQNSASSVLLNRVVGNDPSQIFGKLSANGQVILINPNGIVFGSGGSVSASAFTASTFGLSEQDFANNKYKFTRSGSAAGVTVQDGATLNATAPGGYIALIGASVDNQGRISTQQGAVVMAAGESIALPASMTNNISVPLSGKVRLELLPSTLNAMVANSGTITTEGGQVLMQAAAISDAVASVTHTGSIDTTGEQGGAVTLQADHGIIKATGTIKANSKNAKNKGGDIIIGRDEVTGVLAKATDVSGAKLESQGGFVETSGDYLATDGIEVKAAQWLLDPSDITISNDTDARYASSGTAPALTYTPTTSAATSIVKVSTIKSAIDAGTSVTITTTNTGTSGSGAGNITIANALTFTNNTADATLSLIADNGIIQNATIFATGTKLVNINMEAKGNYQGNTPANVNSMGITLNAAITTNGDVTLKGTTNNSATASASNAIGVDIKSTAAITAKNISITGKSESSFGIQSASVLNATGIAKLDGTSKNWVGVVTTGAVTAGGALAIIGHKTTAAGYQGININSALKGASVAISGDTIGHYGVAVGTSGSVESTVGDVTIIGTGTGNTSMGAGNQTNGVRLEGAVTAKNKLSITGTVNGAAGYQGVLVYKALTGNSIDIKGTSNAWDGIHFANNVSVTSATTLVIDADSTALGKGILFSGTGVFTADSYSVKAKTAVNNGIYFGGTTTFNSTSTTTDSLIDVTRTTAGGDTIFNAGTLTINSGLGKATLQTSTTNVGGGIRINGGSTVNTTGDVTIGSKNSGNAYTFNQGTINAQSGNLTLLGKTHSANNANAGVWMQNAGTAVAKIIGTNGANITIDGTNTYSDAGVNLSVYNSANSISTTGVSSNTGAVGNILITGRSATGAGISNGGSTVTNDSTNTLMGTKGSITLIGTSEGGSGQGISNSAAIKAAGNLTLTGNSVGSHAVNTAGTLEAGGLLKIEGTAVPMGPLTNATSIGIYVGNTVKGGTVSMTGTTGGSKGIDINGAVASTVGDITLTGTGGGNYYYGQGVLTEAAGSLVSAAGITIKGTATGGSGPLNVYGTQIQGAVTAVSDISITGKNTSITDKAGLSIENTIKSTGGNITVTAENTSGTKTALTLNANGKLLTDGTNSAININTNGMDLATGAVVQAGSTGTGTVNIKTTGNNNISIGGADVGNNLAARQILGISNTELGQIKAGNLVIGDTGKTGNITVFGAVSTASATGNITLQTGGSIAVNAALTVGDAGATKNLTLNGAGATSTITQTTAIKASGLELLGANATHTLTNVGNQVTTLAANSKAINYVNSAALTLGAVNATTGINATGDVSIATQAGNLTISENVNTAASTATALVLNAGKSFVVGAAVGANEGGNIVVGSGKTVGVGSGGVAQLMTGSITGDTSAAGLAGAGNFRYNSDEATINYSKTLSTNSSGNNGVNVIYREKPTVTIKVNDVTKVYDGIAHSGGSFATTPVAAGLRNGDTDAMAGANVLFSGTAQGVKDVLASSLKTITAADNGKNALGYEVTYTAGNLTINKVMLTLALADQNKVYDGSVTAAITAGGITATGVTVGGNTESVAFKAVTGAYNSKNVATANSTSATVSASDVNTATAVNGLDLGNYTVPTTVSNNASSISKATLALALADQNKVYDGSVTDAITAGGITATGVTVGGNTESVAFKAVTGAYNSKNVATANSTSATVSASDVNTATAVNGLDLGNYTVPTTVSNNASTITPKPLKALYTATDKVFDGNSSATVTGTLQDIVTGDAVTATHTSATFDTAAAGTNKTVTVAGIALIGGDASNYKLDPVVNPVNTATAKANITAAASIPPAPVVPTSASNGGLVKIPTPAANPFQLASAEELGEGDFCSDGSSGNSNSSCTCEESKLAQDAQICFEKNTQKISAQ